MIDPFSAILPTKLMQLMWPKLKKTPLTKGLGPYIWAMTFHISKSYTF